VALDLVDGGVPGRRAQDHLGQQLGDFRLRKFDEIDASVNQSLAMLAGTKHARGRAGGGIR
jgi:hypothetical protein